jgi:hypothetical protein
MARTGDVNHVEVILPDRTIQMRPREILSRVGALVPEQAIFYVLRTKRLPEKSALAEIEHSRAQIVAGPPVGIDPLKLTGS